MGNLATKSDFYSIIVPENNLQVRIDSFLAGQFPKYSRTFFQKLIDQKLIIVNGKPTKSSYSVKPNDTINIEFPPARSITHILSAEAIEEMKRIPVSIVFEHPEFLIINKPAGLVVHKPSAKSSTITLVDWLLYHFSDIAKVGNAERPGIVHRLDKDTSGLMIIARTTTAHKQFSDMFRERKIEKVYLAVVQGHPKKKGTIDLPIGRDVFQPTKISKISMKKRQAVTNYESIEYFEHAALVKVKPITGRTHQIRVHFAAIGHPLIGDRLYGIESKQIKRQALHASELTFTFENNLYSFMQQPPEDFLELIKQLKIFA